MGLTFVTFVYLTLFHVCCIYTMAHFSYVLTYLAIHLFLIIILFVDVGLSCIFTFFVVLFVKHFI